MGLPIRANSQKAVLKGFITDKITHNPIPYASVVYGTNGVITNSDGEFLLAVEQLPADLRVSHLSYQDTLIRVSTNEIKLELFEAKKQLEEVTISDLGRKVMQDLHSKLIKNQSSFSASGFYRQTTSNNNLCTELIETFNDLTILANQSVSKYKVTNGRYGIRKEESDEKFFKYSNFSYLLFALKPYTISKHKDDGKSIGIPLSPNSDQFYNYQVISKIDKDNDQILEIYCTPNFPERPYFEGSYFINRSTLDILKVKGFIKNDLGTYLDNDYIKNSNVLFTIDMNFMKMGSENVLNYLEIDMTSDFTNKKTAKTHNAQVKGLLLVYNYGEKTKQRSAKKVSIKTKDLEQVKNSRYDPQFWIDNPIIKRTPLENGIVSDFEKNEYFGTYSGKN